jgi:sigma-B regulation protein RsbU (phosphoserine phosphatase)
MAIRRGPSFVLRHEHSRRSALLLAQRHSREILPVSNHSLLATRHLHSIPYNSPHMKAVAREPQPKRRRGARRTREFWARVTEGLALQQLWGQFVSETKASYRLYSADVDWEEVGRGRTRLRRFLRSVWAVFMAMLMKLSPPRRVFLLLAIILLVINVQIGSGEQQTGFSTGVLGVLLLFLLLALELADRVTMKRDLEIAREIQEWLVPSHAPNVPGLDIAFATRPQNTVAGDYYDAFPRPLSAHESSAPPVLIAVADVAGKSVPAALLMATFQASLKALASTPATLGEIVAGLDRYCRAHSLEGRRFTTAFVAQIDPVTLDMLYVNAGHNDPMLRHGAGEIERLSWGGPPFGLPLFSESEAPYKIGRVQLHPGDLLVIFTDGVVEAINDAGEEFGEARLLALMQNPPGPASEVLQRIMANVNGFAGFARQHDDITSLVLRVTASSLDAPTST